MPIPWNDDPPTARRQIENNLVRILHQIQTSASARLEPTVAMAQQWHRDVYAGVTLPVPYYAGEIRDSDPRFPELDGYEVAVGARVAPPSHSVPNALAQYQAAFQLAVKPIDGAVAFVTGPTTAAELGAIAQLAALAHGEWVRIHPFANGNGRSARLWVAWIAARYRLPLFLQLRPRPADMQYAIAAGASMTGSHTLMHIYFADCIRAALRAAP